MNKKFVERILTEASILRFFSYLLILILFLSLTGCTSSNEAVLFTSQDQIYSEPIIKDFEKATGIKVKTVYDSEATKTVGLVNRLLAEKNNPQADVFWNSEVGQTIVGVCQDSCR